MSNGHHSERIRGCRRITNTVRTTMATPAAATYGKLHERSQNAANISATATSNSCARFAESEADPVTVATPRIPLRLKELLPREVDQAIARDPRLLIPVGT